MESTKRATNGEVAELLGISNSMASRLRSGTRNPSVRLMARIEVVFRLKMSAQTKAFGTPEYAEMLERAICRLQELKRESVA